MFVFLPKSGVTLSTQPVLLCSIIGFKKIVERWVLSCGLWSLMPQGVPRAMCLSREGDDGARVTE